MLIVSKDWDEFYCIISRLAKDALSRISAYVNTHKYISNYLQYPIELRNEGLIKWRTVSELSPFQGELSNEKNYKTVNFSSLISLKENNEEICVSDLEGYEDCLQFLATNTNFLSLIWYPKATNRMELALSLLLGDIINRYISLRNNFEYEERHFKEIYKEVTNVYFQEKLEFDICVPILFIEFESENITISDNVFINKMSEEFIKSKHFVGNYDAYLEKLVLDCATHMLVIKGYYLEKSEFDSEKILENQKVYPTDVISSVFASIRSITGLPTGYAQIISYPKNNWIPKYSKGDLLGLAGARAREYPDSFLSHYWLEPRKFIDKKDEKKIADIAAVILSNRNQNALKLACDRLNRSTLRNDEEDSILDAIIGLELLLSDNDKGELTYKISSRMATISTLCSDCHYTPIEVQRSVSQIYRYRSDIVHSRKPREATKQIRVKQDEEIAPVALAIKYLRMAIGVLAFSPEFLTSKKIDELMMKKLQQ